MVAVMTTAPRFDRPAGVRTRPRYAPSVARRAVRTPARYWRRRVAAVTLAVGVVAVAGKAGAALGGAPLGTPPRNPTIVSYVVQPGDSLWTIARRLAPGEDPRPVVDALVNSRHGAMLQPGETIVWQR